MVQLLTTLDIEKKKKKQMDYYYYTTKNSNLFEFSFYRLNYNFTLNRRTGWLPGKFLLGGALGGGLPSSQYTAVGLP